MPGQLTGLHAKFTGDSKSFVRAAQQSAFEMNKLNAKLSEQKAKAEASAASTEGLAKSMHKLRMETDNTYAGLNRFQRASALVTKVAESQKWSQEQLGAELQRLANHYGVAEAAGMSMGNQLKSARFHTANLMAQFNDIGVMMAAGQNPFMLAIQQGTQISQVMQAAGGSTREMGSLLIQSFRAMISPTTLLTLGLIAGGAALVQWGVSALSATDTTKTFDQVIGELGSTLSDLKAITDTLKMSNTELTDNFGKMGVEARNAAIRMLELENATADRKLADSILASSAAFNELIPRMDSWLLGGAAMLYDTIQMSREFNITAAQVGQLSAAFVALKDATSLQDRIKALENLRATMADIGISTEQLPPNIQSALLEAEKLTTEAIRIKDALADANAAAPKAGFLAGAIRDADVLYQRALDIARATAAIQVNQQIKTGYTSYYDSRKNAPKLPVTTGTFLTVPVNEAGFPAVGSLLPPPPSSGGGGVSRSGGVDYASELEQLSKSLMSQEQIESDSYKRREELLKSSLAQKLLTQQEYAGMMEQVEAAHNFSMLKQQNDNVSATLGALGQLFQGSKEIGAAIALTNSYLAFTEVLKDPGFVGRPFARFAAAASALSSGLAAVRSIKSAQPGGSASGGISAGGGAAGGGSAGGAKISTAVSLQLVGGDMYSRDQVLQLINAINAATADGAQIMLR